MVCFAKKLQLTNATRGLGLVVDILVVDSVVAAVHRHSQVVADSTHPHKHHPHRHLGLGLGVAGNAAHKDHRDHRQVGPVGPVGPFHRGPCSHTSPAGAHRDHSRSYDWGAAHQRRGPGNPVALHAGGICRDPRGNEIPTWRQGWRC